MERHDDIETLIARAAEIPPPWSDEKRRRVTERAVRQHKRGVWLRRAGGAAVVAAACLVGVSLVRSAPTPARPHVEPHVAVTNTPAPQAPIAAMSVLRFDDATVTLPATARVHVAEVKPERVELVLERGYVDCNVTHRPSRQFVIKAHGVTVRDIGTQFRVAIEGDDVSVAVTEGEVDVTGCGVGRVGAHGNARCRSPVRLIPQAVDQAAERLQSPADARDDEDVLRVLTQAIAEAPANHGLIPTAKLYRGQLLERLRREDEAARLYQVVAEDVTVSEGVREQVRALLRRLHARRPEDGGRGAR